MPPLLLGGVPGAGKSHYAEHLKSRGWRWLEHDELMRRVPADTLEEAWTAVVCTGHDDPAAAARLTALTRAAERPVVIEFGFVPSLVPVVRTLRDAGADVWWFAGDAPTCLRGWRRRWPEHNDSVWFDQVRQIAAGWPEIADLVGPNTVVAQRPEGPMSVKELDALIAP